jgi:hypothetical protein
MALLPLTCAVDQGTELPPSVPCISSIKAKWTDFGTAANAKTPPQLPHASYREHTISPRIIYRAGAATPVNMTPRITDRSGLSAFREVPRTPGYKYQVIDTSKFTALRAYCDDESTGHVCIVPRDMSKMQEWIDTRGKTTHLFTQELLNAIISQSRT